jgi:hypothetical protein
MTPKRGNGKKSPFISSADFDMIQAQKMKDFQEKYNKTPKSEKKKKTFNGTIQTDLFSGQKTSAKRQAPLPEIIHPEIVTRLPRKRNGNGNGQVGFHTQNFGSIILSDQVTKLNELMKERNALAVRQQEQTQIERLRKQKQQQIENTREQEYKNLEVIDRKAARESQKRELSKRQREQAERDRFARNYQAKDYVSNVTAWTATSAIKKPYSRNSLRSEFVSFGYTGKSGFPELDNRWRTITEAKGSLNIGKPVSKGSLSTQGRIAPTMYDIAGSIGGNVIMPTGILKIKGRRKL